MFSNWKMKQAQEETLLDAFISRLSEGVNNEVNKHNNMKDTELQTNKVTSKEEQLITTKRTAKMILDKIERQVKNGHIPSTFVALQLKQMERMFKETLSNIEDLAKDELVGTDCYIYGDHKLTYKQGSRTADFSECEQIVLMEKGVKAMKAERKAALEGVEKGITQTLEGHKFIDSHGEIKDLPKWKYNKSSIVLTKV